MLLRLLGEHAQHDAVRVAEIPHGTALPEELRVGGHVKGNVLAQCLQARRHAFTQGAGRPHRHGGLVHHQLVALHIVRDLVHRAVNVFHVGAAVRSLRGAHGDEDQVAVLHRLLYVAGEAEPSASQAVGQLGLRPRLVDGAHAPLQLLDLFGDHIQAHHLVAPLGEAKPRDQAHVAGADDGNFLHNSFSFLTVQPGRQSAVVQQLTGQLIGRIGHPCQLVRPRHQFRQNCLNILRPGQQNPIPMNKLPIGRFTVYDHRRTTGYSGLRRLGRATRLAV